MRSTNLLRIASRHPISHSIQPLLTLSTRASPRPNPKPTKSFHTTPRTNLQNLYEPTDKPTLTVNKLTARGFVLSDGLLIPGGAILMGSNAFLWDVDPPVGDGSGVGGSEGAWKGWGKERFGVFEAVVPRPEILLFGTGSRVIPAPKAVREYISSLGIQLDVMDSRNAASTFNLLAEEGRTVAAALCPLTPIDPRTGVSRR